MRIGAQSSIPSATNKCYTGYYSNLTRKGENMIIQKLPWAGIRIEFEGTAVVIDPLFNVNTGFFGHPHEKFYPLNEFGMVDAVFITHLHSDHFDSKAVSTYYGDDIPVYVPKEVVDSANKTNLKNIIGVDKGEQFEIGSINFTAVHSVDGLGDSQNAWVIKGGDYRIIHCGDTLWHGYWWSIADLYGPFDVACLPVNGAVIEDPDLTPSGQSICLTPEQAVSAAVILKANKLMPIHFGAFHYPPQYNETHNLMDRLTKSAEGKVNLHILNSKESIELTINTP